MKFSKLFFHVGSLMLMINASSTTVCAKDLSTIDTKQVSEAQELPPSPGGQFDAALTTLTKIIPTLKGTAKANACNSACTGTMCESQAVNEACMKECGALSHCPGTIIKYQ